MKHLLKLFEIHGKETQEKRKQAIEKYITDLFNQDLEAIRDTIELGEFQRKLQNLYQTISENIPDIVRWKITKRYKKLTFGGGVRALVDSENKADEKKSAAGAARIIMPEAPLTLILLSLTPRDLLRFSSVNHYYSKFINSDFWKSLYKKYGFVGKCTGKTDFLREYKKLVPKGTPLFMEELWHTIAVGDYKGFNRLFKNEHIKEYIMGSEGLADTLEQRLQKKCSATLTECRHILMSWVHAIHEQYFIDLQGIACAVQEKLKIAAALNKFTKSVEIDNEIAIIEKIAALYSAIASNDSNKFRQVLNETELQSFLNSNAPIILGLKRHLLERNKHCLFEYLNSLKLKEDDPQREFFTLMERCLIELSKTDAPLNLLALSYELMVKITDKTKSPRDKVIAIRQFESEVQPWWKTFSKIVATMVIAATGIALGAAIGVALVLGGAWLLGAGLTLGAIVDLFAAGAVTTLTTSLTAGAGLSGVTAGTLSTFWLFKTTPEQTLAKNAKLISEVTHQNLILA